jgi:hypothetical protein
MNKNEIFVHFVDYLIITMNESMPVHIDGIELIIFQFL